MANKDLCAVCGRLYLKKYIAKHKCRVPEPRVFECQVCNVKIAYKANIIRHYVEVHKCLKKDIPAEILSAKTEKRERRTCLGCGKQMLQFTRHSCKPPPGNVAVAVPLAQVPVAAVPAVLPNLALPLAKVPVATVFLRSMAGPLAKVPVAPTPSTSQNRTVPVCAKPADRSSRRYYI